MEYWKNFNLMLSISSSFALFFLFMSFLLLFCVICFASLFSSLEAFNTALFRLRNSSFSPRLFAFTSEISFFCHSSIRVHTNTSERWLRESFSNLLGSARGMILTHGFCRPNFRIRVWLFDSCAAAFSFCLNNRWETNNVDTVDQKCHKSQDQMIKDERVSDGRGKGIWKCDNE